jgi:O-antigen/teichoic acid export membrane protein
MTGSVGVTLDMMGMEHITARGVAISTVINIILNISLTLMLGVMGAALATSISMIVLNATLAYWLYYKTGIVSMVFMNKLYAKP